MLTVSLQLYNIAIVFSRSGRKKRRERKEKLVKHYFAH